VRDGVERFGDRMAALALVRPKRPEALPVQINRGRIYVLPTGFGLFISVLIFAMLIGGLNYNNNPALLLVFLLAAIANNSLVNSHLLLSGIRLKALHAEPVFAGQRMTLRLLFDAAGARDRAGMELLCGEARADFNLQACEEIEVTIEMPTVRRGWLNCGRLRLSTLRPLGLARAWSWLRPDTRLLVYPTLDNDAPPLPEALGDGDSPRSRTHGEQPHHLRDYRDGDAPRQIAWKASARADRLLVREYEAAVARDIELDWFALPALNHEAKIRRLARWVVEAERSGSRYSMRLPAQRLLPGCGAEHRHACLRALALLPLADAPERADA
jgi:uncharacterized protein (DUF58 family)